MGNIILKGIGTNKVKVIKILREATGFDLRESRNIVDRVENGKEYIITNIPQEDMKKILESFMQAGARVMELSDEALNSSNCEPETQNKKANQHQRIDHEDDKKEKHFEEEGPRDDKNIFGGFTGVIKEKLKILWNDFRTMKDIRKGITAIGIFIIIGFCILFILSLVSEIFTSPAILFSLIIICYIVYQRFGATFIVDTLYQSTSNKLQLPDGMNNQSIIESLTGGFDYPYFEGVQYGENGECIVKGKYVECQVIFNPGDVTYLSCKEIKCDNIKYLSGFWQQYRVALLEAIAIRSYINKFFNPTLSTNAAKDFDRLKMMEKQRKVLSPVLSYIAMALCLLIVVRIFFPNLFQYITSPGMEVRGAYLSQYSEEVTVGDAFDNFFAKGKWSKYKADDGYKYVVFTGSCEYLGQPTDTRITFKITGDNFRVDSVEFNGQEQNDLVEYALLIAVFSDY